jgi:hypothetical protein
MRVKRRHRSIGGRVHAALCGIVAACALVEGCGQEAGLARDTIASYVEAVQERDLDRLYCLVAGAAEAGREDEAAARAQFAVWALERFADYDEGRDRGRVELDDQGIVLVKLFALGKGTYFGYGPTLSPEPGILVVDMDLRFGYGHVDLSGFSPGTTFYLAGAPVGQVRTMRVPEESGEVVLELLESVRVRWTLVRGDPVGGCPGGWTVSSAVPVEGSEKTAEITWIF